MRLSTVFELLLIFLLIAFAAYGRVIDRDEFTIHRAIRSTNETSRQGNLGVQVISLKQAAENVNKYCTCDAHICNCCRNFNIPIVQLKGPGCASLQYLEKDKLAVQLSMGDNILTSTVVNGQKPKPVCFPMPGGLTKFCGRIYSIQREADNHFKACLGLELQSSSELEAALRVSCFRFGPDGVQLRPAEQLPIVEEDTKPADDDDDDDDIFGLDDDDDDDDDDEDSPEGNAVPGSSGTISGDDDDDDEDDDDDDVLGLGSFFDLFGDDDESNKKKKKPQLTTSAPILPFTIPILTRPTTAIPSIVTNDVAASIVDSPKPITSKPITNDEIIGNGNIVNDLSTTDGISSNDETSQELGTTQLTSEISTLVDEIVPSTNSPALANEEISSTPNKETAANDDEKIIAAGSSNDLEYVAKPNKKLTIVKKIKTNDKKKPSLTSGSQNAIKNDSKKPLVSSVIITKPNKPDPVQTYVVSSQNNDVNDEEDDDDILSTSDLVDDDDDDENDDDDDDDDEKIITENVTSSNEDEKISDDNKHENDVNNEDNDEEEDDDEDEDEKTEEHHDDVDVVDDLIDDDDEDDEEEEAEEESVISALVEDDEPVVRNKKKVAVNTAAANNEEDEADYGLGLAELLARRRSSRNGRQSKVMRL